MESVNRVDGVVLKGNLKSWRGLDRFVKRVRVWVAGGGRAEVRRELGKEGKGIITNGLWRF